MSSNIFMTAKGEDGTEIKGSSTDEAHKEAIEVVSWSHAFSQPTTAATKSSDQQATSRANHMDFNFTKFFDNASDEFCKACWTGAQLEEVVMMCYRASGSTDAGGGATDYLMITMNDVIVSNYSISGGGDELPIESITLNYTKIEYKYKPVDMETGKAGSQVSISHDLGTNKVE